MVSTSALSLAGLLFRDNRTPGELAIGYYSSRLVVTCRSFHFSFGLIINLRASKYVSFSVGLDAIVPGTDDDDDPVRPTPRYQDAAKQGN